MEGAGYNPAMSDITLAQIIVYPVKSLGGIVLRRANVGARGLEYDRRWMLTDENGRFLTQRELPSMARISPVLSDDCLTLHMLGSRPLKVPLCSEGAAAPVQIWRSHCEAVPVGADADAWFGMVLGVPCRLMYMPDATRRSVNPEYSAGEGIVSFADGYPVMLLGESSLVDLNSRLAQTVPMNRFRPNLVVSGSPAFAEDRWSAIKIGEAHFHGVKLCDRCVLTTINQDVGERTGPEPLQTLAAYRRQGQKVMFGRYIIPEAPSVVSVGDSVEVLAFGD